MCKKNVALSKKFKFCFLFLKRKVNYNKTYTMTEDKYYAETYDVAMSFVVSDPRLTRISIINLFETVPSTQNRSSKKSKEKLLI